MAASGRSGDTTFGHNGVNSHQLSKLRALKNPDPDVQNRLYSDTPEVMRSCIKQGICPFCGESYKNLAKHTTNTHGVGKDELKEMAGIPKSQGACSSEFSQQLADSVKQRPDYDGLLQKLHASPQRAGQRRNYSAAGSAVQRAKLEAGRDPVRVGKTNSTRRLAAVRDRDAQILARVQTGELLEDIARSLEIHPKTARTALRRLGVTMDFRKQAAQSDQRKRKAAAALAGARKQKCGEQTEARLQRWADLGKTWGAVSVLAAEWGTSEKQVRGFLRAKGASVPDGRKVYRGL